MPWEKTFIFFGDERHVYVVDAGTADAPATLLIELDGSGAGATANGLWFRVGGTGSAVRGLVINGFARAGILVEDGSATIAGN